MNVLVPASIDGEIISPRATVRVIGRTHPLQGGRLVRDLAAGLSISELMAEALSDFPEFVGRRDFAVHLDGHPIEEKNWHRIRVKAGVTVTFWPRLQNSGTLRAALSAVVVLAALIIAPYAAPGVITGLAALGISVSVATATALAAAGIMLAGTLALNALFPVAKPAAADNALAGSAPNSIQGAQNQANPFGPIPVVLGTHRQSPYYAAKPYTEIVGNDQYLRLLFCMGYGPISLTDLKIGETPLTSFLDYGIEIRQGLPGDPPVTLYPGEVDEVALSITLSNTVDPAPVNNALTTGGSGPWTGQTTSVDTDEFSLDFTATQGCYRVDDKTGDLKDWFITVKVRYRRVGDVSWTDGGGVTIQRTSVPFRVGLRHVVARGQYEVQASKYYGDANSDKIKDTAVWTALRSIKNAPPIAFPKPLALVALRIKATDQLSGVINTFNAICSSLVLAYSGSGSTWNAITASQSPADLFRWVLQGPANARPQPDSAIDIANLQDWWTYCVANGFKFNQVINSVGAVYDKLCEIAASGRAVPTFIDGKWGVIWDRPADPIMQHFTPRNSWGFQGQKSYAQQPHGWRISFINEDNGFTADERIVYDDGYSAANATLFEGLPGNLPGVTDPDLIWKHGRFQIAQARLRPENVSLNSGWENLICTRGDRVAVTHDVLLIGLASGRVNSVAGQVVTFDETVTVEAGKTYGMSFRLAGATSPVVRALDVTAAGDYKSLTLVGDLTGIASEAAADLRPLFAFGETSQEYAVYRVKGIAHQKNLIASLTLVDDAPDISTADSGAIPAYSPNVTIPADPFSLPPRDLKYLEVIDGVGTSVRALVRLFWQVPRFGRIASFEVQQQDDDHGGPWVTVDSVLPPYTSVDVPLVSAGSWSFRVRCIFNDGSASDWASLVGLSLVGLSSVPGDITNLHQLSVAGQAVLDWDTVTDQRAIYYEVRKGNSWDTGLVVGDVVTQPPWPTTGDGSYFVRAYVLSPFGVRIYSADAASIAIAASIIPRNIIVSKDEQATGWTGGLDGGVIDGSFIRTDVAHVISLPFALEVVDTLMLSGLHIAVYVSSTIVDIGRAAECRFWTEFEASGILIGDDFLGHADVLGSGDILGTSPTRFITAFPIWHFSSTPNDVFNPSDVFAPSDIFSPAWLDWVASASGTRVARYFNPGFVLITNDPSTNATGTKFSWFVDVPDRTDDYTSLTVPDTGLAVTFYSGGYAATPAGGAVAIAFNGGPNGSSVPHVQRAIVNGTNGDEVKITNLTLAGCTVNVVNAGVNVTRAGVNLLVRGY